MNQLNVSLVNGAEVIDSREVAEVIGKQHKHLLADIRGYVEIMENSGEPKFRPSSFFIPSTYINAQNREMPRYLLTKKGCDMVANKLTGEKGVLFTAAYVTAFEAMHQEVMGAMPEVSLRGTASFIRVMRRIMLDAGHSPLDVEQMTVGVCRTWRIPLPEKVVHHAPNQISMRETDMLSADET